LQSLRQELRRNGLFTLLTLWLPLLLVALHHLQEAHWLKTALALQHLQEAHRLKATATAAASTEHAAKPHVAVHGFTPYSLP
jgi:hypothetical protein